MLLERLAFCQERPLLGRIQRVWPDEKPSVDPTNGRVAIAAAEIERRNNGNKAKSRGEIDAVFCGGRGTMRITSVDAPCDRAIGSGLDSAFRWPTQPPGHGPDHHSNREVTVRQRGYGPISTEIRAGLRSWIKSWIEGSAMEMSLRPAKERTGAGIAIEGTKLWIPMLLR